MRTKPRFRPTIFGMMYLVGLLAVAAKIWSWAVVPALEINRDMKMYFIAGVIGLRPFWPQFWRRLRHLPDGVSEDDIFISDDGGILFWGFLVMIVGLLLTYRLRKSFFANID